MVVQKPMQDVKPIEEKGRALLLLEVKLGIEAYDFRIFVRLRCMVLN